MPKVILNKSTKINKSLVMAGVEVEVTADEEKQLKKGGFLGEIKKDNLPNSDKEISALVAKVAELEKGADKALKEENKTLKSENDDLKKEIKILAGDKEEHKGLLAKFGLK